jgi:hypothetical protein
LNQSWNLLIIRCSDTRFRNYGNFFGWDDFPAIFRECFCFGLRRPPTFTPAETVCDSRPGGARLPPFAFAFIFSARVCLATRPASRERRRAVACSRAARSARRRWRIRARCASDLTISAKKSGGRENGRRGLDCAARSLAAEVPCNACV